MSDQITAPPAEAADVPLPAEEPTPLPTPSTSAPIAVADTAPSTADDARSTYGSDTTVTPEIAALSTISSAKPKRKLSAPRPPSSRRRISEEDQSISDVVVYGAEGVAKRRVVFPASMVSPAPSAQGDFAFQRALVDSEFLASGHLHVTHHKSAKNSKDNTYIFYVVEGSLSVRIHQTHHTVHTGDMFLVPRGNLYSIENLSPTPSRLIFCQAREITPSYSDMDPLRLIKLPKGMTSSKAFILLGWLVERLLKRFAVYRKMGAVWGRRARFVFHQHVHGGRAYLVFFVLGFLARSGVQLI